MPNQIVDIAQLTAGQTIVVRQESEAEQNARIEREQRELTLRLEKERVMFYGAGSVYVASLLVSFYFAVGSDNVDVQKWAMSLVTLLAGGLVGFLTGKSAK
jgi:hypothetical protein